MQHWIEANWDWLMTGVFLAVATSTTIGLRRGTKGGALFVSNSSSAIVAVAFFPFLERYGYSGQFVFLYGMVCGAVGVAVFGVLVSLSDAIDRRREKIADNIIDRVTPHE
jgi:hypothetical protein